MGIYTNSTRFSSGYAYSDDIAANENYNAAFGCAQIMMDIQKNDMAMFEATICNDIQEVMAYNEGSSYVNENAITDIIKKVIELFKKLIAKIKGIIKSFLTRIGSAFTDNKQLVKKYGKQIIKYGNWKNFKVKDIRLPSSGNEDIISAIKTAFSSPSVSGYNLNNKTTTIYSMAIDNINENLDKEDIKKNIIKEAKYFSDAIRSKVSSCEKTEEFKEEILDTLFESKDTLDEDQVKSGSYFTKTWIQGVLENSEKTIREIEKSNKELNSWIDKIIDQLEKFHTDIAKVISKDGENARMHNGNNSVNDASYFTTGNRSTDKSSIKYDVKHTDGQMAKNNQPKTSAGYFQKIVRAAQTVASNEQEVCTMFTSLYLDTIKFAIGQARKIYSAAAVWSSRTRKEESYEYDTEYVQAVAECAEEEFYNSMECIVD